jgi:Nucleotide-diphospho-sugar transferase
MVVGWPRQGGLVRDGVLFVATGEGYRSLARRAAHSVARACPGLPIDLHTDAPVEPGVFSRVTVIDDPWFRSRIDAMVATRFERTLHLDADVLAVADLRDVFEVLDRFDIALAQDQARNSPAANALWRAPLPPAFPQFNGGVIAYRSSPAVHGFLRLWAESLRQSGMRKDQPSLRELLWLSDLRIATLPPEYNLLDLGAVRRWDRFRPAPRLIHHYRFHKHFTGRRREVATVEDLLGPMTAARLPMMLAADRGLARLAGREPRLPTAADRAVAFARGLAGLPGWAASRLGFALRSLTSRP